MAANGFDISRFNRAKEIAESNEVDIDVRGDCFFAYDNKGNVLGKFYTVDEIYFYMCGYDTGLSHVKGKVGRMALHRS